MWAEFVIQNFSVGLSVSVFLRVAQRSHGKREKPVNRKSKKEYLDDRGTAGMKG